MDTSLSMSSLNTSIASLAWSCSGGAEEARFTRTFFPRRHFDARKVLKLSTAADLIRFDEVLQGNDQIRNETTHQVLLQEQGGR